MNMDAEFWADITRFKLKGECHNYQKMIHHQPTNLVQLNLWCELMLIAKIKFDDVPDNGVFYLHDRNYEEVIGQLGETQKNRISFKIQILVHVLAMSSNINIAIVRQLEQCLMIAKFGKNAPNNAIKSYIKIRTDFLSACTLDLLVQWLIKFTNISNSLASLDTITLINIVMNRLSNFPFENQALQNFMITQNKKSLCMSLKDYVLKSKNYRLIQFLLSVSYKLNIQDEMFKGSICNQNESEILYAAYYKAKNEKKLDQCKNLESYMLKNSAIRGLALHQILQHQPQVSRSYLKDIPIQTLIKSKSNNIYAKIKSSPFINTSQCLIIYLKMSQFTIHQPTNHRLIIGNKQSLSLSPLSFMAIHKHLWYDAFHRDVLNLCLWIMTDHWLLQAQEMITSRADLEEYKRNIYLALFVFMMGYPLGSFVCYYPTEKNFLADIFNLPNFATLILNNSHFREIPWFIFVINSQLKTVIRQQNGYELAYKILNCKGVSFQQHFGTYLLNTIEEQVQKPKLSNWLGNKKYILKILEQYRKGRMYTQKAQNLKIAVQTKL